MKTLLMALLFGSAVQSFSAPDLKLTGGFSMNESILGASLAWSSQEVNIGVKRFGFSSNGTILVYPGVSVLQRIGDKGYFASATIAMVYYTASNQYGTLHEDYGYLGSATQKIDKGFGPGFGAITAGKTWTLSDRWSIDADIGGETPLKGHDAWTGWNLVGGVGAGFKF
jgi:hypothetical protein